MPDNNFNENTANIDQGIRYDGGSQLDVNYPNASSNDLPPEEITNALLLLSDTSTTKQPVYTLTTETNTHSTADVNKFVITFTHSTDKGQSTYAALLSILFQTVQNVASIHLEENSHQKGM